MDNIEQMVLEAGSKRPKTERNGEVHERKAYEKEEDGEDGRERE